MSTVLFCKEHSHHVLKKKKRALWPLWRSVQLYYEAYSADQLAEGHHCTGCILCVHQCNASRSAALSMHFFSLSKDALVFTSCDHQGYLDWASGWWISSIKFAKLESNLKTANIEEQLPLLIIWEASSHLSNAICGSWDLVFEWRC